MAIYGFPIIIVIDSAKKGCISMQKNRNTTKEFVSE